jgi:ubiquinone/menaquinone biosynthesis C-methylase UbiE
MNGDMLMSSRGNRFPIDRGIPRLLPTAHSPREKTEREKVLRQHDMRGFPDYAGIGNPTALVDKARRDDLMQWVDRAIPNIATVLEIGCGTGQMTNYLGLVSSRTIIGTDMSFGALRLGQQFKERCGLRNVHFLQADPAFLPIEENSIDVLICTRGFERTDRPEQLFRSLLDYVKPGGKIILGLHNSFARLPLRIRRMLLKTVRKQVPSMPTQWYSLDDALTWFERAHVRFLSSIPSFGGQMEGEENGPNLFREHPAGSKRQRVLGQVQWMPKSTRTGGLIVLAGEKQ